MFPPPTQVDRSHINTSKLTILYVLRATKSMCLYSHCLMTNPVSCKYSVDAERRTSVNVNAIEKEREMLMYHQVKNGRAYSAFALTRCTAAAVPSANTIGWPGVAGRCRPILDFQASKR